MKHVLEEKKARILELKEREAAQEMAEGDDGTADGSGVAGVGLIRKDEKGIPVADADGVVGLLDSEKAKGLLGNTVMSRFKAPN